VLERAEYQSVGDFRQSIKRAVVAATATTVEEGHEQAMSERRVSRVQLDDGRTGMTGLWAVLSDTGAATVYTACDAYAARVQPDDPRTADQRRADALVQIALDALHGTSGGELPLQHGLRPAVQVTVALSTLIGADEQPGELDGHGCIPAALARRIAADATGTWRRLVTDDRGRLVDYGRATYRPPKDLADFVIARDRTCRFRHCTRRACRCDLDHVVAWDQGGQTNEANLHALCCRHHHGKHEAGWTPRRLDDGDTEWRSPTGRTYREPAATYPVDQTITLAPQETVTEVADGTDGWDHAP
jgi:hypothetical protein